MPGCRANDAGLKSVINQGLNEVVGLKTIIFSERYNPNILLSPQAQTSAILRGFPSVAMILLLPRSF